MENIAIPTTQNITIEQPVASIGERIAAAGIDYLFYAAYMVIMIFISGIARSPQLIVFSMFPLMFYHLFAETVMNGQSWGKRIMKIKVVKIDGTPAHFPTYFIRWIFRIVDITLLFGAVSTLTIILNGKGQRLGDIAANTTVIRIRESSVYDTIFTRLPENYQVSFPEVKKLADSDIYTVKEVLQFVKKSGKSMNALSVADKAKKALENKMEVDSRMRSVNFLYAVLRDYNYIHSR